MYTLKIWHNDRKLPQIENVPSKAALEQARYTYESWEVEVYKDGKAYAVKAPNETRLRYV